MDTQGTKGPSGIEACVRVLAWHVFEPLNAECYQDQASISWSCVLEAFLRFGLGGRVNGTSSQSLTCILDPLLTSASDFLNEEC